MPAVDKVSYNSSKRMMKRLAPRLGAITLVNVSKKPMLWQTRASQFGPFCQRENIPSFLVNGQFTQEEVNNNRLISRARTHVERSIQRLKLFHILDHIPYQFRQNINKIAEVCVCLTNLQTPIIREIE